MSIVEPPEEFFLFLICPFHWKFFVTEKLSQYFISFHDTSSLEE